MGPRVVVGGVQRKSFFGVKGSELLGGPTLRFMVRKKGGGIDTKTKGMGGSERVTKKKGVENEKWDEKKTIQHDRQQGPCLRKIKNGEGRGGGVKSNATGRRKRGKRGTSRQTLKTHFPPGGIRKGDKKRPNEDLGIGKKKVPKGQLLPRPRTIIVGGGHETVGREEETAKEIRKNNEKNPIGGGCRKTRHDQSPRHNRNQNKSVFQSPQEVTVQSTTPSKKKGHQKKNGREKKKK